MRTKSEAKILETDVVIFPMKFGQNTPEKTVSNEVEEKIPTDEIDSNKIDYEIRFARLRKSLRKRSVSIL
jgi:translation initiation factor IF-1